MNNSARLLIVLLFTLPYSIVLSETPALIEVDANASGPDLRHVWQYYGFDECNYASARHGKDLLAHLARINTQPVYIRSHCLLNSGDGIGSLKWGSTNVYTRDPSGKGVYYWTIMDEIFDAVARSRCLPLVEIGFMPRALSPQPDVYERAYPFKLSDEMVQTPKPGWTFPPTDYAAWDDLIRQWARHSAMRYPDSVEHWLWELWNEPNIFYWSGSFDDYCKLFDHTEQALHSVLPHAAFGGPHVAGPDVKWLERFLDHCANGTNHVTSDKGTRLDYIGFHSKGRTQFVDNHPQLDLGANLRNCRNGFAAVARFPQYTDTPVIIGECDPEGMAARSSTVYPANGYRNGTPYAAYVASIMKNNLDLAQRYRINLQGVLTWAFLFDKKDYFEGFRTLATNGVRKPVLLSFEMLSRLHGQRISVSSSQAIGLDKLLADSVRSAPDIDAIAAKSPSALQVLIYNYHDDIVPSAPSPVTIAITPPASPFTRARIDHYRIDDTHSNTYTAWLEMGSPQHPSTDQLAALDTAGTLHLLQPSYTVPIDPKDPLSLKFDLPRFAVSLIEITWLHE
jgi:xylan 1,4-beta-xylosidase